MEQKSRYGTEILTYNFHSLLHLSKQSLQHGPIDSYGAFCFENHLGKLKRILKSPTNSLAQVVNRISEHSLFSVSKPLCEQKLSHLHFSGPLLNNMECSQYHSLIHKK